jgi:hypothetical protein
MAHKSHGIVTRKQLQHAGLTPSEIKHRVGIGSLLRVHRGVYRVGHAAPSRNATYMAAVLACGAGAVLSGRAAAHLLGLLRGAPPPPEVTAPHACRITGIKARRSELHDSERWLVLGIPVTSVAHTLVDLAGPLSEDERALACHEAGVRYGTARAEVDAVLARRPSVPGAGKLRKVLHGDVRVSLSRLESAFLALLRDEGLPLPQTNVRVGGRRVDCRWPQHRLTVELDSYRYHRTRQAWERDRRREREAYARGDQFRRYTYEDVLGKSPQMLRELRTLLAGAPQ